jgi:hypothetical protein
MLATSLNYSNDARLGVRRSQLANVESPLDSNSRYVIGIVFLEVF